MNFGRESYTVIARRYIYQRPSVRHCLSRGLINHSELARQICESEGIAQFDAIHSACKRFERVKRKHHEVVVKQLLADGQILLTNKISLVVLRRPKSMERLLETQSEIRKAKKKCEFVDANDMLGVIVSSEYAPILRKNFQSIYLRTETDLAQITFELGIEGEKARGILSHITGLLAFNGINIVGETCYWGVISLLLGKNDVGKAIDIFGG